MTYDATLLEQAHRASMRNRGVVLESDLCACFSCLATFEPCAVRRWTDHDAKGVPQTPFCPSCGMDAVLAKASGFSLDREFLLAMHEHFCTNPDSLSELLVALADKLWKGKRHSEVEQRVVEAVAEHTGRDAWDLFVELDSLFERIAGTAEGRLRRSNVSKV